jgi:hypothetical protein
MAAALAVAACAPIPFVPPQPETSKARGTPDEAHGCAMRTVNEMQYEVVGADRGAGFLRARKERSVGLIDIIANPSLEEYDILTVTVYPSSTGSTTLRALARWEQIDKGEHYSSSGSKEGLNNAATILKTCGVVPDSSSGGHL